MSPAARADIVFLNGGEELTGAVRKIGPDAVTLEMGGATREIPRKDVLRVKLVREWRLPGEDDPSRVADPAVRDLLKAPPKPEDYPDDGYVTVLDDKACELRRDGSSLCRRRKLQVVLRERGKDKASNARFYYLDGAERGELEYARSITGGKISYLDDTSVQEGSEYPYYPLYDRLKSTKFAIPNVSTGSVLDYRYRVESFVRPSTFPFFASMYFRSFEPTVLGRFSVVVPKGTDLRYVARAMPPDARFTKEESGDSVRYAWEVRNQPSYKEEDRMPPYPRLAPAVTVAPADSWKAIGARLAALIQARLAPGPEVAAKTRELTEGKRTAEEKAEALYDWVAKEIKYQPVDMDSAGYLPRSPADIYQAKGGDNLDKPFLLFVMLREAGLEPRLVYMESKSDAPFLEALPSLRQFSAAAVALELGGKTVFLTPFQDSFRWRETPGWLQGVRGLVAAGGGPGAIVENPTAELGRDGSESAVRLTVAPDGSVEGSYVDRPRGDHQAGWRSLKDYKKEDLDKYFEELAHGIHPNARLTSYSVEHLEDPTQDLVVHLAYAIKDYAITADGGYMAFRLPWIERPASDVGQPSRETPMFWFERNREAETAEIVLPEGYALYYAPDAVRLGGSDYFFRASYASGPDPSRRESLAYSEEAGRAATQIPAAAYAAYKAFREDTARFAEKWIVLKKK